MIVRSVMSVHAVTHTHTPTHSHTHTHRYCELEDPMALRRSTLEDSIRLHQFSHDAMEELRWVLERRPTAHSTTLGDSLTSVQSLIKKHQVRQEMGEGGGR